MLIAALYDVITKVGVPDSQVIICRASDTEIFVHGNRQNGGVLVVKDLV
jgi:glycosylphosphatidylinositol transamidase (GPIT) subunit GPI8